MSKSRLEFDAGSCRRSGGGEVAARSMAMVDIAISVVAAAGGWNGSRGGCTEGKFEVKGGRGSG